MLIPVNSVLYATLDWIFWWWTYTVLLNLKFRFIQFKKFLVADVGLRCHYVFLVTVESHSNGLNSNKAKYNKLIEKAKELGRQGQLEQALGLFEKAYKIHQSEKLGRKIEKLKVIIV